MCCNFCALQHRTYGVIQRPFGQGIREHDRLRSCAIVVFDLVLFCLLIYGTAAAQIQPTRRILILNEVNPSYPAINIIFQGIQTALSDSPYRLEFYSEHLDTILFPDAAVQQDFRDFYLRKYRNPSPM